MPALSRSIGLRGPRFYISEGELMFVNHYDASTREGPRPATKDDSVAHPAAWAAFVDGADEGLRATVTFSTPEGTEPDVAPMPYAARRARAARDAVA